MPCIVPHTHTHLSITSPQAATATVTAAIPPLESNESSEASSSSLPLIYHMGGLAPLSRVGLAEKVKIRAHLSESVYLWMHAPHQERNHEHNKTPTRQSTNA